jgi:hypothetical protein
MALMVDPGGGMEVGLLDECLRHLPGDLPTIAVDFVRAHGRDIAALAAADGDRQPMNAVFPRLAGVVVVTGLDLEAQTEQPLTEAQLHDLRRRLAARGAAGVDVVNGEHD